MLDQLLEITHLESTLIFIGLVILLDVCYECRPILLHVTREGFHKLAHTPGTILSNTLHLIVVVDDMVLRA